MARNVRSMISPIEAQENAAIYIRRIGAVAASVDAVYSFVPGKPIRKRGRLRNGRHRGHTCSATSRGSGKRAGN